MAQTYLNGKITVSSLAAPTPEDINKIEALTDDERRALLGEVREMGRNSPISNATMNDIWNAALEEFEASQIN